MKTGQIINRSSILLLVMKGRTFIALIILLIVFSLFAPTFFSLTSLILVATSQLVAAHPATGNTWEMNAIAASVLGGTSMSGGIGTIGGTIVGAFVIGVLNDGMVMLGVSEFWQMIIKGAVIIIAVIVDQFQRNIESKIALRMRSSTL